MWQKWPTSMNTDWSCRLFTLNVPASNTHNQTFNLSMCFGFSCKQKPKRTTSSTVSRAAKAESPTYTRRTYTSVCLETDTKGSWKHRKICIYTGNERTSRLIYVLTYTGPKTYPVFFFFFDRDAKILKTTGPETGYWKICLLFSDQCYSAILPVNEVKNKHEIEVFYFKVTPSLFTAVKKRAVSLRVSSHLDFGLHSF